MSKQKGTSLNWDDFQKMGNPENAPEEPKEPKVKSNHFVAKSSIRVHLEKRKGKPNSIIRGLDMTNALMKDLERELKSFLGVGGSQKNGEIIIQGDNRDKIIDFLKGKGAKDIKKSGG
jgi:translation initiation factor 1